jgi:hypothetical protein
LSVALAGTVSGAIAIGKGALVGASNTCIIGGTGADLVYVGLGGLATAHSYLTVGGSLATGQATISAAGPTALDATHHTVFCDSTAASVTVTLPTAAGIAGRRYVVKKLVAANSVIVATTGGQLIDGATPYTMTVIYDSVTVQSDGANWWIV